MAWTTPRTWVDGELVTSTLLNTHIRDNLNWLRQGDPGWTDVVFQNGWQPGGLFSSDHIYTRRGSWVFVEVVMKNGTMGTVAFTLPVGYRPTMQLIFSANGDLFTADPGQEDYRIYPTGEVIPNAGDNTYFTIACGFTVV